MYSWYISCSYYRPICS